MYSYDKVIKGLECCMSEKMCHSPCPYNGECEEGGYFYSKAIEDAIALLKAQQPRLMTLEEVKASKDDDMYLEISTRTDEVPYITAATLDGVGTKGVAFYCSHFDFVAYNRRLYGWRCWTSRPNEKVRVDTPWVDFSN